MLVKYVGGSPARLLITGKRVERGATVDVSEEYGKGLCACDDWEPVSEEPKPSRSAKTKKADKTAGKE